MSAVSSRSVVFLAGVSSSAESFAKKKLTKLEQILDLTLVAFSFADFASSSLAYCLCKVGF